MNHEFIYSQTAQYIISNNILPSPPPNMSNLSAIGMGRGGGLECDQISDIRPPKKSNIRYQTPPKKSNIRYLAFTKIRYLALKKSDVRPPKK